MRKNIWMYQWGCLINASAYFVDPIFTGKKQKESFFDGFNSAVWLLALVNAGMGFSVSFLLKYFDTIIKGFASCLGVFVTTLLTWVIFSVEIDASFLIALVIFSCSTYLYIGKHNDDLKQMDLQRLKSSQDLGVASANLARLNSSLALENAHNKLSSNKVGI